MKEFTNDQLKEIFKDAIKYSSARGKIFRKNPDIAEYCQKQVDESDGIFKTIHEYIKCIVLDIGLKKCPICGKPMTFDQTRRKLISCSLKCAKQTEEFKEHRKQTNIERYGCENPNQCEEVKEKFRQTCLKRFGAPSPLSKESSVKGKIDQHWKDLGVENPGQLQEVKDKIKKTNLERYGNEAYLKSDEFYKRRRETCLEHFGVEHQFMSKEIQDKAKNTLKERYNVENAYQLTENQEKATLVKNEKSYENMIEKVKNVVIPLFTKDEWAGWYEKQYKWRCCKCGNEFEAYFRTKLPRCLNCFSKINGFSYMELDLLDFCKQFFPSAAKDKQLIKPLELDIVIPEIHLAIEFNGIYYHCIQNAKPGQHLNKTLLCNEKGYRLIHILEDEWKTNKDEIKSKLEKIFKGEEDLTFTEFEVILDRAWFNNINIPGYEFELELSPGIVRREEFEVEDCGKLKFKRHD